METPQSSGPLRPLRPGRILAVARRDLRGRSAGKSRFRGLGLIIAVLIPLGALHFGGRDSVSTATEGSGPAATGTEFSKRLSGSESAGTALPSNSSPPNDSTPPVRLGVRGPIPPALEDVLYDNPSSTIGLASPAPPRISADYIPGQLRKALDTLPGRRLVKTRRVRPPGRAPGRSVLIVLLAISLLTGPLAETLPGERSRRTLEVLLSAGISRSELVVGKWLAWTAVSTGMALVSGLAACVSGVQAPGLWLAALPLVTGTAVALGLWLLRDVADVVGGAATPMRVLPIVTLTSAALTWPLATIDPLLAAAVPLGGALLVAADLLPTPGALLASTLGSSLAIVLLLRQTAMHVDRFQSIRRRAGRRIAAPAILGITAWWMAVGGPGIWTLAGNPDAAAAPETSGMAGGMAMILIAIVSAARAPAPLPAPSPKSGYGVNDAVAMVAAIAAGLCLALVVPVLAGWMIEPGMWLEPSSKRLVDALIHPAAGLPGLMVAVGGTVLFWGTLAPRAGHAAATALFALCFAPTAPVAGLTAGMLLGGLNSRFGAWAACLAWLVWQRFAG